MGEWIAGGANNQAAKAAVANALKTTRFTLLANDTNHPHKNSAMTMLSRKAAVVLSSYETTQLTASVARQCQHGDNRL
jgi:hypothetical protein